MYGSESFSMEDRNDESSFARGFDTQTAEAMVAHDCGVQLPRWEAGRYVSLLDECGGHFGPTDDYDLENTVVFHYHATTYSPYHIACQGPALQKCSETQTDVDFCGNGCGAELCIQPGTSKKALAAYVGRFNTTWLDLFTTNVY